MLKKTGLVLLLLASVSAGNAAASTTENSISVAAYRLLYRDVGTAGDLPKVLVFSPKGECVGVTTGPANELTAFITKSLSENRKQCKVVVSENFGVTKVGKDSGTNRNTVILVMLGESFCIACNEYRGVLSGNKSLNVDLKIVKIDFSKKTNVGAKSEKDCKECGKR